MYNKKLLAIIMVAIMAIAPVAIIGGAQDSNADDAKGISGSSVEIKDVTVEEMYDAIKDITGENTKFEIPDSAVKYIVTVLFPGLNPELFTSKEVEVEGKKVWKTANYDDFLNVKLNVKIMAYSEGATNENIVNKLAITVEAKDFSAKIKEFPAIKDTVFSKDTINKGLKGIESAFVDGKYIDGIKAFGIDTEFDGDSITVSGSLSVKFELTSKAVVTSYGDKYAITSGGINVTKFVGKFSKYLPFEPFLSDVRVSVDSDITANINDKTLGFRTSNTAVAVADLGYEYAKDGDRKITEVRTTVNDLAIRITESAVLAYDGKDYENNKFVLDLTDAVRPLLDGRVLSFKETISNIAIEDFCVVDPDKVVYEDIAIPEDVKKVLEAIEGISVETDAKKVSDAIDAVANEIKGVTQAQSNTAAVWAMIIIAAILIIACAYIYQKKKKV